ncbi:MAG: hypothetical protein VB092_06920 [Oscillospiraceae bacterium]|nr:hypothetical protein [Oscillospiraceae bacterium]
MNFDLFLQTLPYMGLGMLGIFIVTAVIILCIYLLNALSRDKDDK